MKMTLVAGFAVVVVAALCQAEDLRFQTATVTRNMSGLASGGSQIQPGGRVTVTNTSIRDVLRIIYDLPVFAIVGAPEWFSSERYDIAAQASGNPSMEELKQMMRNLLIERFKIVLHQETRQIPVFELKLRNDSGSLGPHLIPAKINCEVGGTAACPHELKGGSFTAIGMPIARIVRTLAELSGRPIVDKTNLSGFYDVDLTWTQGTSSFITAVREQLGLELKSMDEQAQVLVIDSAVHPTDH